MTKIKIGKSRFYQRLKVFKIVYLHVGTVKDPGFYGPGTGTFLIIAFSIFAKMDVHGANGLCKAVNLTTNATSLAVFLTSGQVLMTLGLAAAACNMAGNWIGAGMAMKAGTKITRPIILFVLVLLFIRVVTG